MSESSRLRPLPWLTALVLAVLGSLQACDCGSTGADTRRFACAQDDECTSGFVCRLGECQPEEEPDGGVDSGVPDGGGTDGGPDAGPTDGGPTGSNKLALITAPLTLQAGQCSAAVIIETQDPLGRAIVPAPRPTINLASAPSTGFRFYSDSSCGTLITSLTVQFNRSRVTFYVRGTTAQSVQITASATNWLPATQTETIIPGPPTVLAFLTTSQTLPAGGCSAAVDFETRDSSGNVSPIVATQARVGLTALASAGLSFFTDSGCTTAATEVVLTQGSSRGSFYFKGRTGGTFSLSASATGFTTSSQSETILPAVRTGTCTLPSGSSSVTCSISPPQLDRAKTLLLFQASSNDNTPDDSAVRCSLSALNSITCSRHGGNGTSDPSIRIQWQTAELVSGLTVQHLQATCGGTPLIELPIQPVSSLQQAFLLVSSEKNGVSQGDDDYYAASLFQVDEDGFHVDLEFSVDCVPSWQASIQVVELAGANVTRGLTGSMTGNQLVVSNLSAVDLTSTALLFTYRTSGASGTTMCDRVLRGELTSPTSITFSRGAGAAGCTGTTIDSISWERIEFGTRASTQHVLLSTAAGGQTATAPITAVDTTRTLVFATGQIQSGQGGGETSFADDDVMGASVGWHTLTSPTTLDVTRGSDGGVAQWNSTVLQLVP